MYWILKVSMLFLALLLTQIGLSQNQDIADSLLNIYSSGRYNAEDRQEILLEIVRNHPDPGEMLFYSEELIKAAESIGANDFLADGYMGKGMAFRYLGDLQKSMESFFEALEIASYENFEQKLGRIYVNIADCYSSMDNHDLSVDYYNRGIEIIRHGQDSAILAASLINAGDEYKKQGNPDSALVLYSESSSIFRILEHEIGVAYSLGNTGQVYEMINKSDTAELLLNKAISMLIDLGDFYPVCAYYLSLSDLHNTKGNNQKRLDYAFKSLEIAESYGLKEEVRDASEKLSQIYSEMGDEQQALLFYKKYIAYRDSLKNIEAIETAAMLTTVHEVSQKQAEVDLLTKEAEIADLRNRRQKWVSYGTGVSLIFVVVLAVSAVRRYRYVKRTNKIIETEKNRSEDLLLNILPRETAQELRLKGEVKARKVENVTVLFTDFIEFTRYSEKLDPEKMVRSIDFYFKRFDEIVTKYNLEKIKTIGDSYMCAGGLHTHSSDAENVILAALDMVEVIKEAKLKEEIVHFEMRIGIHTGPVVAGVVGTKKFQYDIWGDTVNIASGMESNSESGRINISETTYLEVKDRFTAEYRGKMDIKYRDVPMKMYFIEA